MRTTLIFLALLALTIPGYLAARAELLAVTRDDLSAAERDRPPRFAKARAPFLNYATFAADLAWIEALIYNGDFLKARRQNYKPEHYVDHARAVAELDPDFRPAYEWLNTTYIASRGASVTHDDLTTATDFLDRGIARFPTNAPLLFQAGMNFIGYSAEREPADRLAEIQRAIGYLERCAKLEGCPSNASSVVAYLYNRERQLEAELRGEPLDAQAEREAERDFYLDLLRQTTDPEKREQLERSLSDLGVGEAAIARAGATDVAQFEAAYRSHWTFLPLDLWTLIVYPVDDPLAPDPMPAASEADAREPGNFIEPK